jgi:hypothetical protein
MWWRGADVTASGLVAGQGRNASRDITDWVINHQARLRSGAFRAERYVLAAAACRELHGNSEDRCG